MELAVFKTNAFFIFRCFQATKNDLCNNSDQTWISDSLIYIISIVVIKTFRLSGLCYNIIGECLFISLVESRTW